MMDKLLDKFLNKFRQIYPKLWPFANLGISNLSARFLKKLFKIGIWVLVSW